MNEPTLAIVLICILIHLVFLSVRLYRLGAQTRDESSSLHKLLGELQLRPIEAGLRALRLEPGDLLVIVHPHRISRDAAERVVRQVEPLLPGVKVLFLDEGVTVGKIAPPATAPIPPASAPEDGPCLITLAGCLTHPKPHRCPTRDAQIRREKAEDALNAMRRDEAGA